MSYTIRRMVVYEVPHHDQYPMDRSVQHDKSTQNLKYWLIYLTFKDQKVRFFKKVASQFEMHVLEQEEAIPKLGSKLMLEQSGL